MKKPRLEILLGPFFVMFLLVMLPLIFEFEFIKPLKLALSDFDITDIGIQLGRKSEKVEADTNMVLVNVNSMNNKKLFYLLDELSKHNPKVIGIDLMFDHEKFPEYKDSVLFALTKLKNVVFASELKNYEKSFDSYTSIRRVYGPYLQLGNSGYRNLLFGRDNKTNTVRTFRPVTKEYGLDEHSFAVEVASKFSEKSAQHLLNRNNDEEIIDYFGNVGNFFLASQVQILTGDYAPSLIEGKIILLGRYHTSQDKSKYLEDMYFTPLCEMDEGKPFPDMDAIVVQANIIKMIVDKRYYSRLSEVYLLIISFVLVYLNFLAFYYISDKLPLWYEILSNILFLIQSLAILVIVILLYNKLRLQADFTFGLFGLAITIIFFEAYKDNIVPLTQKIIYILKHRRI